MKEWTPWFLPWIISWAKIRAWVAITPRSPGQNLAAEIEGVFIIKVSSSTT